MTPSTFSIKGWVSLTFADKKEEMSAKKIWTIVSKAWESYPNRVTVSFSTSRGNQEKTDKPSDEVCDILRDLTGGFIDTMETQAVGGKSMSLLLGTCHEYRIPFGVRSEDTGHTSMIVALPVPMPGCYIVSCNFSGSIKRSASREHYVLAMSLDIYIGSLERERCDNMLQNGYKVFPFRLRCPDHFINDLSSESEGPTDMSEEETERSLAPPANKKGKFLPRKSAMKQSKRSASFTSKTKDTIRTILSDKGLNAAKLQEIIADKINSGTQPRLEGHEEDAG